jgi:hypothetical protein
MAIEVKQKEFTTSRGVLVMHVTQLPATRAMKLLAKLGKLLGPSLAKVVAAARGGSLLQLDADTLTGALSGLFEQLTDSEIDSLVTDLTRGTVAATPEGQTVPVSGREFDSLFQGSLLEGFRFLGFVLEVNFQDFFGAFLAVGREATDKQSSAPSTSQPPGLSIARAKTGQATEA